MKRNHYENLEISFELNSGLCEEQNSTYGEKKERAKKQIAFLTDPYAFTKKILGEKQSSHQESTPAETDSFFHNNLRDPNRNRDLTENTLLIRLEAPTREFDLKEPTWDKILQDHFVKLYQTLA